MTSKEEVCVKVLMYVMNYASSEISKFDDVYKSKLAGLTEIIVWKVADNISFITEIKDGNISGSEGSSDNATMTFEIGDVNTALELFTGRIEMDKAMDKVKIIGDAETLLKLNFILDTVKKYIGNLSN